MGRFVGQRPNWKKAIVTSRPARTSSSSRESKPWVFVTHNPTTPGRRGRVAPDFAELSPRATSREKSLTEAQAATGGRNNYGRITSRFRGGGHKRRYRMIDFKRNKIGVPAKVAAIEYDPNRTRAHRAAALRGRREALHPLRRQASKVGDTVISSRNADIKPGNSLPLRFIPLGTTIHNVELKIGARRADRAARPAPALS